MAKRNSNSSDETIEDMREKRLKLLDNEVVTAIEREHGQGLVFKQGQALDVGAISTGSIAVDHATGVGGIPRGRITEIYGPESSGKTTLCLHVIAQAQQNGGICAFIDMENALDPRWARTIGVDLESLYISQPDYGEQALRIAQTFIQSGLIDVVVIDSVAALVPKAELDGDIGDSNIGLQARLMSQALRKMSGAIRETKTAVMFTNQLREKVGIMFGNPEVTSGGRALKFYASMRFDIRRIQSIKQAGEQVGNRTRIRVTKNKVAAPFREAEFDVMFGEGISLAGEILDLGVEHGIINKSGAYYKFQEETIGQGREKAKEKLQSPEYAPKTLEIHNAVLDKLGLPLIETMPNYGRVEEEVNSAVLEGGDKE